MNAEMFSELEARASEAMLMQAERADLFKRVEAHARVNDVIAAMKDEGKALELTDEEERLLRSFRRFKATAKKAGVVFKWQTRPSDGVIVESPDGVHISDPQDVSAE